MLPRIRTTADAAGLFGRRWVTQHLRTLLKVNTYRASRNLALKTVIGASVCGVAVFLAAPFADDLISPVGGTGRGSPFWSRPRKESTPMCVSAPFAAKGSKADMPVACTSTMSSGSGTAPRRKRVDRSVTQTGTRKPGFRDQWPGQGSGSRPRHLVCPIDCDTLAWVRDLGGGVCVPGLLFPNVEC